MITARIELLDWLSGDWQGEDPHATLEEHYSTAVGGTILGTSRETADGASMHREFLLFEEKPPGLTLTVIIPLQRDIMLHLKHLKGAADDAFVFESPQSPMERLTFHRLPSQRMRITLDKEKNEGIVTHTFLLHRKSNADE